MPELHRAAQAYLTWTVESDVELVNNPTVAFYKSDATGPINWLPAEWVGDTSVVNPGLHRRTCRALVAGPNKVDPSPQAIVLASMGTWLNAVRITDNSEEIPLSGEPVRLTK